MRPDGKLRVTARCQDNCPTPRPPS
jgi:hypothetical protein